MANSLRIIEQADKMFLSIFSSVYACNDQQLRNQGYCVMEIDNFKVKNLLISW